MTLEEIRDYRNKSNPFGVMLHAETVELALGEVSPIDDVRASKQYRLDVVAMALRRSLESLG